MKRISIPANPKSILLLGAAVAAVVMVIFVSELVVGADSPTSLRSFSFSSAAGTMSSGSYGISAELGPVGFVGRSSSSNYTIQMGTGPTHASGASPAAYEQDIRCIYDANGEGDTGRGEAIAAVTDYLLQREVTALGRPPDRQEAVEVVTSYLLQQTFTCAQ